MGKAAYDRGSKALRREIDEDYKRNPHAASSRAITELENRIDVLESRLKLKSAELTCAKDEISTRDAKIAELEDRLAKSERKFALKHKQFMRWFREAESLRRRWHFISKVVRFTLSPEQYHDACKLVRE